LLRNFTTTAAAGADTAGFLELGDVIGTLIDGFGDLLIGYCFTDTDEHMQTCYCLISGQWPYFKCKSFSIANSSDSHLRLMRFLE